MGKLEVSARMTIRRGQLEGFKQQAAEIIRLFKEFADGHAVTVYGDPSPQLVEAANTHKDVDIKWYSFLRGLES
jgi:hypothetical protein